MNASEMPPGYSIRPLANEQFEPLYEKHGPKLFDNLMVLKMMKVLSEEQQSATRNLRDKLKARYRLNLGVFYEGDFVGWSYGFQKSPLEFYMENSAIFPQHRKKGLYTALLNEIIRAATAEGFQGITSSHHLTNNSVIIAKLKAGFMISGVETLALFGTLVRLDYFVNPVARKIMEVRCGYRKPDAELSTLLGMDGVNG